MGNKAGGNVPGISQNLTEVVFSTIKFSVFGAFGMNS